MKKLVLLLPLCLLACAELQKDFETRTCHYDGAYQAGVNDAQDGKSMKVDNIAYQCPENTKAEVRKGYREGYTSSKRDAAPAALVNALMGTRAQAQKCSPKAEAHRNFCADLDKSTCNVHSGVCRWE